MNLDKGIDYIENLIHSYLAGAISEQEKAELFNWLVKEPANLGLFNQIADIWLSSSVFQDIHDFNATTALERVKVKIKDVRLVADKPSGRPKIQLSWKWAAAILILTILSTGFISNLLLKKPAPLAGSSFLFEVPYGSKSNLKLPDGSAVVLNAGSRLTISEGFGITHRTIDLIGEGYFKVKPNKSLPFLVHAGKIDVKALGTEFNVKAYPEDKVIETILISGMVEVKKRSGHHGSSGALLLKPKQTLVYHKESGDILVNVTINRKDTVETISLPKPASPKVKYEETSIDPVIYTSWKEDSWNINSKSLSDLAIELERKYDVTIIFHSEALKTIKFTGTLKDESLEQVLAAMSVASPVEYKIKGKLVELTENKDLMKAYKQYFSIP